MADQTLKNPLAIISTWPAARKISLLVVAVLSLAVFTIIIIQARIADYRLLYANLADSDASAVIAWLKDQKVPYRLEEGGKAIHIPADKVYEVRLQLAGAGLPQGGSVGFEIFDKQSFGMTDFAQKVNYQRALQGELARTITSLAPVEGARVMLALPEKRLFKDDQQKATSSVIVKLAPGQRLSDNQVQGIIHLVAGSIEGLESENVTVIDSLGRILSRKPLESLTDGMTPGMLEFQQAMERRFEQRAQSLLDKALGPNNSLARVTAELDFSKIEKMEEIYDPTRTVARREQVSEEKSGTPSVGGVPGVASNLGGSGQAETNVPTSSSTETTNYEISKTVNRIVAPVGTVKSLSVAVLVADRYVAGNEGQQPTHVPRPEKELLSIKNMITSALGLDASRGDKIEVISMPFEGVFSDKEIMETTPTRSLYEYLPYAKYGLLILGSVLLYFLLIRPLLKTVFSPQPQPLQTVQQLETELMAQEELLSPNDPTLHIRKQILASETSPTQVIRSWLNKA